MARSAAVNLLSIAELSALIQRRKKRIVEVRRERNKTARHLARIDRELAVLSGSANGGHRPHNEHKLVDVIQDVLAGARKPLTIGDITAQVQASGYRSVSPNFRMIVNQALIKEKRFHKESRGLYALKV